MSKEQPQHEGIYVSEPCTRIDLSAPDFTEAQIASFVKQYGFDPSVQIIKTNHTTKEQNV